MTPTTARTMHIAFVLALALLLIALSIARPLMPFELAGLAPTVLRYAALGELIVAGAMIRVLKQQTRTARGTPSHREDWWHEQGPRVVVLWALALGAAVTGAIVWFLTGDGLVLAAVTGLGTLMLLWNGPRSVGAPKE